MFWAKLALLALHISAAAILFGNTISIIGSCRRARNIDDSAFRHATLEAQRAGKIASIMSILVLLTGVGLIFTIGGFAAAPKNFHLALGLILVAIIFSFAWMKPNTDRLVASAAGDSVDSAAADAAMKKLAMGSGILHTLWLGILLLMYIRYG